MTDFPISAVNAGIQRQPAVARFPNGLFVVAWADGAGGTIRGAAFSADGQPALDAFAVSGPAQADLQRQHPVAASVGDGFVAAWIEGALNPPGPQPTVRLQRFDSSARRVGPEIGVGGDDIDPTQAASVCRLLDGGFVVAWMGSREDRRVLVQHFSPDGLPRGEPVLVNEHAGFHRRPLVSVLTLDRFVVTWTDGAAVGGGGLRMRLFDGQGAPLGAEFKPNLFGAEAITLLGDSGRFVVASIKRGVQSDIGVETTSVRADVIEADGRPANIPIFVSSGRGIHCSSLAVAALPGARLVACWLQKSAETFDTATRVMAAVFSGIDGARLGAEMQIDAATAGEPFRTAIDATSGGEGGEAVCVAWDRNVSGSGAPKFDVRGRVLALRGGGFEG
jgi:hypothetical protein